MTQSKLPERVVEAKGLLLNIATAWITTVMLVACAPGPSPKPGMEPPANRTRMMSVNLATLQTLDGLIANLGPHRVVFVGESHDRYGHHLAQLAIIRELHAAHPNLVIAMEFFQQPYQGSLDDYIAGAATEAQMLVSTEYFTRWRFDYRLYRPILEYAREQGIPLLALNVPTEVSRKVAQGGIDALKGADTAWVPEGFDRSDTEYEARIREIFEHHPQADERQFEYFFESQLLWDEGMARRAADYLETNPDAVMVVLAGSGHLAYRSGIPARLARHTGIEGPVVLIGAEALTDADVADHVLIVEEQSLPPRGLLGIFMEDTDAGVIVAGLSAQSAAAQAGMQKGDRLLDVGEVSVTGSEDVRIALLDAGPGESVSVRVARDGDGDEESVLEMAVTLGQ
ncbi:MAG: ChaN family lipoprotein [Pseudomonadota bacterium]|nr:ChaN family lipoprotein [Pseudomonadota bacterium]